MRYRKLDANGDYTFGNQQSDFLRDSPEAVGQAVMTRLQLYLGEWFLDTTDGTAWRTEVLGKYTKGTYDAAVQNRILGTQGVSAISSYSSTLDPDSRGLSITATIDTIYGQAKVTATI